MYCHALSCTACTVMHACKHALRHSDTHTCMYVKVSTHLRVRIPNSRMRTTLGDTQTPAQERSGADGWGILDYRISNSYNIIVSYYIIVINMI